MGAKTSKRTYVLVEEQQMQEMNEPQDERNIENNAKGNIEDAMRSLFAPILDIVSCRMMPHVRERIKFGEGYLKSICSIFLVSILLACILLQIIMLLAYITDMVFRPLLFIKLNNSDRSNMSNSSSKTSLIIPELKDGQYQEFRDWFLFIWDYLYGLIGLYSTIFLFLHSWQNEKEFLGIFNLIKSISKNKTWIRENPATGAKEKLDCCQRLTNFITCSDNRMQLFLDNIGWGVSHLCIIILSIALVAYWFVLNAYATTLNDHITSQLAQDSDLALVLALFDAFHWHLSPVIVCFLIRITCMEITTSLDRLRHEFAAAVKGEMDEQVKTLWRKFYEKIKKVDSCSTKYRRISAINIAVLIFAVVGLSIRYFNKDINSIDQFISYDWLDFIRFFTWYIVHLLSVWFMIDAISTLNQTIDYFADEILIILAEDDIDIDREVKTQLDLCIRSKKRFSIDLFGVVTPATVHLVMGFGSATIVIFISEGVKIIFEKIQI